MAQAKKSVFLFFQSEKVSIDKYYEEFKALVAVVETYGVTFVEPSVIKSELILASMTGKQDMTM